MRSFSEIKAECSRALDARDFRALRLLAEELEQLRDPISHAYARYYVASINLFEGDLSEAEVQFDRALSAFDALENVDAVAMVLVKQSQLAASRHMPDRAHVLAIRGHELYSTTGNARGIAASQIALGSALRLKGNLRGALEAFHSSQMRSDSIGDALEVAKAMLNMAVVHAELGEFKESQQLYERAIEIYASKGYEVGIANAVSNMGNMYLFLGDYPKAYEKFDDALNRFSLLNSEANIAHVYSCLGCLYCELGNDLQSLDYLFKSLALNEKLGRSATASLDYIAIGASYLSMHEYETALKYLTASVNNEDSANISLNDQWVIHLLSQVHIGLGSWKEAEHYVKLLSVQTDLPPDNLGWSHIDTAVIQQYRGEFDSAHRHLSTALEISREHGYRNLEMETLLCFRELAAARGDLNEYVEYNTAYTTLSSEVKGAKAQMQVAVRAKEKEIELARNEKQLEHMRNEQLETTLQRQQQLLSSYAANLVRQTELVEEMRTSILSMIKRSVSSEGAVDAIRDTLAVQPSAKNNWQRFFTQFHEVYPNFENDLRTKLPTVSPTELKVCCLVMMGMNTRDIATLLFVSERTIDIHRGNIRKKLGIDRQSDLRTALALFTS